MKKTALNSEWVKGNMLALKTSSSAVALCMSERNAPLSKQFAGESLVVGGHWSVWVTWVLNSWSLWSWALWHHDVHGQWGAKSPSASPGTTPLFFFSTFSCSAITPKEFPARARCWGCWWNWVLHRDYTETCTAPCGETMRGAKAGNEVLCPTPRGRARVHLPGTGRWMLPSSRYRK